MAEVRVSIGDLVVVAGKRYIVNRVVDNKGRLQIDAIEEFEAKRRWRDLESLLAKAGVLDG